jgi:GNAT superfamily N-acetyltransferase
VPFAFAGAPGREELPEAGWDGVIRWAHQDRALARPADALSALDITLLPSHRGRGASRVVLDALRGRAGALGYRRMFAPVRPTAKHLEPLAPMAEYIARSTADGLPADPWLRVHVRAGGEIVKVAPTSMVVAGSLADWRR